MRVRLEGDDVVGMLGILRRDMEGRRRRAMRQAVVLLKAEAQARIHSPEGRARRGIRYRVTGTGEALKGVVKSRSVEAIFSQRSRGPNTKMPPTEQKFSRRAGTRAIARWLRRIGQMRTRSSAFLVARAIARKGTHGHPVMADALRAKRAEVLAMFNQILRWRR